MGRSNGPAGPNTSSSTRASQRIVLLAGDEQSEVKSVLTEYSGADLQTVNVNEEVPKFAAEHTGSASRSSGRTGWAGGGFCGGDATNDAGIDPGLDTVSSVEH